jgi:MFS family permease
MAAPYYGWYVVAACATIACFSWGVAFYGLGVYLHVLVRLHGWPTGVISVAVTAYYLIGAVLVIAVGRLIDRHGRSARADLYLRGNCGPSGRRPS